jgi:hypothetical protein
MARLIGILLLTLFLVTLCRVFFSQTNVLKRNVVLLMLCVFAGLAMFYGDQLSELQLGNLRLVVRQIKSDAVEIAKIRKDVESTAGRLASVEKETVSRLETIKRLQVAAEQRLGEMENFSEFSLTLAKAKADDLRALQQLIGYASDSNNRYQSLAFQAVDSIRIDVSDSLRFDPPIPWPQGRSIVDVPYDQLHQTYEAFPALVRPAFLAEVWNSENYPLNQKIQFMMNVIERAISIRELDRACRIVDDEAKLHMNFLGYKYYLSWWETNKDRYIVSAP